MAWMIARDDSDSLSHYGVPGMRKGVRRSRAGMPSYVQPKLNSRFTKEAQAKTVSKMPNLTNEGQVKATSKNGEVLSKTTEAIKKKLRSNNRYKASRAGMPSYIRR